MNIARIAAALAFVALVPSVAQAQTLTACYVQKSGTVYRIKVDGSPAKCAQNHVEFSWNAAGQVGPQGPQGPQGDVGPQGPAGESGATGLERLNRVTIEIDPGDTRTVDIVCTSSSKVAIGGAFGSANGVNVHASEPNGPNWRYYVTNNSASAQQFRAWIICIDA